MSRLAAQIAHVTVEAVLQQWDEHVLWWCPPPTAHDREGIAGDGKTLRGSKRQGAADAHRSSAFSQQLGVVLEQTGVSDKTHAVCTAGTFLVSLALTGQVVTAATLPTQQTLAQTILDRGDDLVVVKYNQAQLRADRDSACAEAAEPMGLVASYNGAT